MKTLLICGLAIFFAVVNGDHMLRSELDPPKDEKKIDDDERGIISNILSGNGLRPPMAPRPPFVSSNVPILSNLVNGNGPISGIINAVNAIDGLNMPWVNDALRKCAIISPTQLTAIFPTSSNGFTRPKIYYFQNNTGSNVNWFGANEWCAQRGMTLVTINDANENRAIIEKIRAIIQTSSIAVTNNFWIGLNDLELKNNVWKWIGDPTSSFTDWHTAPILNPNTILCTQYSQLTSADNIRMSVKDCDTADTSRFVCEVSDACTSLFMSLYPHKHEYSFGLHGLLPHTHG